MKEQSSCGKETGVVAWLAHIVPFVLVDNSHCVSEVPVPHHYLLTLTCEQLSTVLAVGLTYKKVKGSRTNIIERAVRLQRRTAFLAVHLGTYLLVLCISHAPRLKLDARREAGSVKLYLACVIIVDLSPRVVWKARCNCGDAMPRAFHLKTRVNASTRPYRNCRLPAISVTIAVLSQLRWEKYLVSL